MSTYYVSPTGSDGAGGSQDQPWQTLQYAADQVVPGDTVLVAPGAYAGFRLVGERASSSAPIVFAGSPGTTINQPNTRTPDGIDVEKCSGITIQGFAVDGSGGSITRAGIRVTNSAGVTLRDNTADRCGTWGIYGSFTTDLLVDGNTASRSVSQHGIYIANSSVRPVVRDNTVWGNKGCGIHMNGDASQGGRGIIVGALVEGNIIYDNGAGGGSAINADGVQNSRFQNNLLYNNQASGISLFRADAAAPSRNDVIVNNTIIQAADSRWAVSIRNGSTGTILLNNILYNNNSTRGSITIDRASLARFVSDYNALDGRFSLNSSGRPMAFAGWRRITRMDRNSLISDPASLFVDPADGNYQLCPGSPAIGHGTMRQAPPTDLAGQPRAAGKACDIGAYVYQP